MSTLRRTSWRTRGLVLLLLTASVLLLPAAEAQDTGPVLPDAMLDRLSQGALIPYLKEHPAQAPDDLTERLQAAEQAATEVEGQQVPTPGVPPVGVGVRFNNDGRGLPQNEESITRCVRGGTEVVLGGTNDFRGLFNTRGNFTGWHFSNDGVDSSVEKEGLLPAVRIGDSRIPSGGDPVVDSDAACNLYAASLALDPVDFRPNGIAVYRTTPETLADCQGGACWPTRRVVAAGKAGHFLDKEWMYVGPDGSGGTAVWTVYTDFGFNREGETSAIKAVRCTPRLVRCSDPIAVSGAVGDPGRFVSFSDVTISSDGRAFVTWTDIQQSFRTGAARYTHKMKVTSPGSLNFGPTRTVAVENKGLPPGGVLNANDFRIATIPKNEVREVNGVPKVFVVWDACAAIPDSLPFVCERPVIKLRSSTDRGQTWSPTNVVSEAGANYFPTISGNEGGTGLKIAYFTSREDERFDNRQDIELATVNPVTNQVLLRQDLTSESNESEADPVVGGFFIGDYIEVFASGDTVLVHYNANYVQTRLLGDGLPIPQQDNFLIRTTP